MMNKLIKRPALVVTLLIIHLALLMGSAWNKSSTCDEFGHHSFGLAYLNSGYVEKAIAQRMPVSALNALPTKFFFRDQELSLHNATVLFTSRTLTMAASLLLCLIAFRWSFLLYGWNGGLLTLALCTFSPNIIAHGRLITTDIYSSLTVTLACYAFWRLCRQPSTLGVLASAATLGLAQSTKFFAIILIPAFAILLMMPDSRKRFLSAIRQSPARWLWLAIYPSIAVLAMGLAYRFHGLFTPFSEFTFHSDFFAMLQSSLPSMALPLPRAYIEGLDIVRHMASTPGMQRGPNYLLGHLSHEGWWYYYFVIGFYKIPLGFLALWVIRIITSLRSVLPTFEGKERTGAAGNGLFLTIPAILWITFFSFAEVQIGLRHLLPAMTLLFIFTGGCCAGENTGKGKTGTTRSGVLRIQLIFLISGVITSLAAFPDYISYTNELMVSKETAYRIMADSNLDWGQDRYYLEEYLADHPDAIANPRKPTVGHLIVRINYLVGIFQQDRYKWLRENFRPVESFHGSHLVFKIDELEIPDGRDGTPE